MSIEDDFTELKYETERQIGDLTSRVCALENAEALKPSHNKQSTPCQHKHTVGVVAYYKCSDCGFIIEPERD